jgi:hypothetical protein
MKVVMVVRVVALSIGSLLGKHQAFLLGAYEFAGL